MPDIPEGYHWVRGHMRRNPQPRAKKMSGWMLAALLAGVWLWGQIFGFQGADSEQPAAPKPSVSAPATR